MNRLDERNQVRAVVDRYEAIFPCSIVEGQQFGGKNVADVLTALRCLNLEKATAEQVATITGSPNWVKPRICDECGQASWDSVALGNPDVNFVLCKKCITDALILVSVPEYK
jgi:hypothetical protein